VPSPGHSDPAGFSTLSLARHLNLLRQRIDTGGSSDKPVGCPASYLASNDWCIGGCFSLVPYFGMIVFDFMHNMGVHLSISMCPFILWMPTNYRRGPTATIELFTFVLGYHVLMHVGRMRFATCHPRGMLYMRPTHPYLLYSFFYLRPILPSSFIHTYNNLTFTSSTPILSFIA
jgi:hypothetical protein